MAAGSEIVEDDRIEMSDGDVRIWIEQESVHILAADRRGDPIELTAKMAKKLADALHDFAARVA